METSNQSSNRFIEIGSPSYINVTNRAMENPGDSADEVTFTERYTKKGSISDFDVFKKKCMQNKRNTLEIL